MIALLTDFGLRDAYVAQMKGVIYSINPRAQLLDVTHEIRHFDIHAAAYVLEASARYFPAETIFVVVIDPGVGSARHPVMVHTQAQKYYIGPDNGLFTRILHYEGLQAARVLTNATYFREAQPSATFHGRDIFAPVAAHLSLGVAASRFGPSVTDLVLLSEVAPHVDGGTVKGQVIYIDHFGNVVTNIPAALLTALGPAGRVRIMVAAESYTLPFVATYTLAAPQQLLCLINSDNLFELAVNQGSAASRLHVQAGAEVVVLP